MVRTTQRLVIALSAVVLLAGCTAEATSPAAPPAEPTASTAPPAAGAESTPRPVPSVSTTPAPVEDVSGECVVQALDEGTLDGVDLERVRDRGTRVGATGTASTASDGAPASYLVAAGDISERIADRFCISSDYLSALNSVRRDGVDIDSLYGGDTLNLRPTTVLSVGDQNGRVLDNAEPDDLPAQTG
ncbi:hypothetical protein C5C95_13225 [Rathayibacter sp. AY1B7]|uniref:hypothetical protein n=1 Tax=unclassified Rathayibacter TaxID=2609250 RepID=UPI000CE7E9FE|nr:MULTISPECIES: hypothetical protein [unclassified Rathayibacter]PPG60772.1 hypothetical protein C5C57_04755 [Rathayibacter sp. AY1C5]PPH42098.1 hypothetical protein C5C86_05055 [Rathayibacter sp. AY1E4]PPH82442.1 hypothetical protein C5C50_06680 [Rathayibacter sp. AY1D9]PPH96749.1 hypothetical protein C5C95_13225 [Rathayibacter sp. AY1B7]PPH99965.1 hypothetical protein C5C56_08130 [Rathayibacter sp. AY1D1]